MGANKICKVCGKEYVPCRSLRPGDGTFNWRVVACSPRCGEEYFRRVSVARGEISEESEPVEMEPQIEQDNDTFETFDADAEIETFFND